MVGVEKAVYVVCVERMRILSLRQGFSRKCKFSNCLHDEASSGCFFLKMDKTEENTEFILSRLDSYRKIYEELSAIPFWKRKD